MTINTLPVGWLPLADAVVKATLILAMAAAASFSLRRKSAALRHMVWTLALCSVLALPLLSLALPKWQLPIVRLASTAPPQPAIEAAMDAAPIAPTRRPALPGRKTTTAGAPVQIESTAAVPTTSTTSTTTSVSWIEAVSWQQALLAVWLAGAIVVLSRLAIGLAAVRWLSRRTPLITDAPWLPMAQALAVDMGVHRRLRFLRSRRASMPVAAGIFRPSVIMPADADQWSDSRLRIVLLHELAHVKRRDCLTHLLAQAACAFYWFNPLAWMAAKRARAERERACDDLVLASGTRGSDYADQLLDMARGLGSDGFAGLLTGATLAMAHKSQLEGRLIAILDPRLPRAGVSRARAAAAIAVCACAVAPLGALQPWTSSLNPSAAITGTAVIPQAANAPMVSDETPRVAPADARAAAEAPVLAAPSPQPSPAPAPQPSPSWRLPEPTPILNDVLGPIAQVAVDAITANVAGNLEWAIDKAGQDAKPGKTGEPKPGTREGARQTDPRMVEALTAALKDSDKEVRETAMHALVQLRDPSVFEPLTQALKDSSSDVREQAAFGLGQLRDKRAIEPLVSMLKDVDAEVRQQVVFALGQLRDRAAVPGLVVALKDAAPDVREQAAFALGQIRDGAAVDGLAVALKDENPGVREQAVFALSQIRDPRAVSPLISALKDTNAEVRQNAAFALGQLRDRTAVEALIIALKDTDAEVREQIVFALGQIRDPRAIDGLTLALKDANAGVRRQAAFALGQLAR